MAKVSSAPFHRGVRFRSHQPDECMASECSLLCDDLARVGFRRALIDPQVVTTYHHHAKAALYTRPGHWSNITGIRAASWREVAAAPGIDWSKEEWRVDYGRVECCDLPPGRDLVDWDKGCRRVDVMGGKNFTRMWLANRTA